MTERLDVSRVVHGAFMVPWWNRRAFGRALAIPLVLMIAAGLSWNFLHGSPTEQPIWLSFVVGTVYLAMLCLFAITCHRLVLLETPSRVVPRWSWRETRFFLWTITVWTICIGALIVLSTLILLVLAPWLGNSWGKWVATVVAALAAFYLFARFSPVFPATAIDRKVSLEWAWKFTQDNGWRLFVVVAVLPWFISEITGLLYRGDATALETVAFTVLSSVLIVVEIVALSLSYRELTQEDVDPGPAQEQHAPTGSTDS